MTSLKAKVWSACQTPGRYRACIAPPAWQDIFDQNVAYVEADTGGALIEFLDGTQKLYQGPEPRSLVIESLLKKAPVLCEQLLRLGNTNQDLVIGGDHSQHARLQNQYWHETLSYPALQQARHLLASLSFPKLWWRYDAPFGTLHDHTGRCVAAALF